MSFPDSRSRSPRRAPSRHRRRVRRLRLAEPARVRRKKRLHTRLCPPPRIARFFRPGRVGIISKSGALSYEIGKTLSDAGIGQSTIAALGGGPIWGFTQKDAVEHFSQDPDTDAIVLLGEIGGNTEEQAAAYIKEQVKKPVVALIVGRNAPKGKSLGHAGAIVSGSAGTAAGKITALQDAGAHVVYNPKEMIHVIKKLLNKGE